MCSSLVRDPYDDGVMDDFGDFGDFGVKGAIEAVAKSLLDFSDKCAFCAVSRVARGAMPCLAIERFLWRRLIIDEAHE